MNTGAVSSSMWMILGYMVLMCIAMPFTAKVTDAIYPDRVFSSGDWLTMWFFNLFAALLWPLILPIGFVLACKEKQ